MSELITTQTTKKFSVKMNYNMIRFDKSSVKKVFWKTLTKMFIIIIIKSRSQRVEKPRMFLKREKKVEETKKSSNLRK